MEKTNTIAKKMLKKHEWDTIVNYMDFDICESLHTTIAPCTKYIFLVKYFNAHLKKFGKSFVIN